MIKRGREACSIVGLLDTRCWLVQPLVVGSIAADAAGPSPLNRRCSRSSAAPCPERFLINRSFIELIPVSIRERERRGKEDGWKVDRRAVACYWFPY